VPVIVKINNGTDPTTGAANPGKQHRVVIVKFNGDDTNPTTDNFTCADPYKYTALKKLSEITLYTGLFNYKEYYK
jgi:hypothetical protein